jgi:hypothetical protein
MTSLFDGGRVARLRNARLSDDRQIRLSALKQQLVTSKQLSRDTLMRYGSGRELLMNIKWRETCRGYKGRRTSSWVLRLNWPDMLLNQRS